MEVEKVAVEGGWMGVEVVDILCAIAAKKMPQVISRGEQVLSQIEFLI